MKLVKKLSECNERYNVGLKLLAVIISVLVWLVVVNVSDPVTSTTFSGVPVEIINGDTLISQGKIYENISAETVTVTVSAKRSILDSIGKENLKAVADMDDINEATGEIKLKVESSKYNEKIESMKAKEETITVSIDNLLKKQLPIMANVTGTPAENYVVGDVSMDQNIVRISGPEKVISQISRVAAEVSVEGMSSNVSTSVELKFYNEEGTQIIDDSISRNISSVAIVTEILATKEVAIKAYTSGTVQEGYGTTGEIKIKPSSVVIAGKLSVLKGISEITIPSTEISLDGATENVKAELDLADYLPDNTRFADTNQNTKLKVEVGIAAKEVEAREITKSMITVLNMPEGFEGSVYLDEPIKLELTGMSEAMSELKKNPMTVSVDIEEYMKDKGIAALAEATYEVPLTLKLPAGVSVVGKKTFTVNFRVTKVEE